MYVPTMRIDALHVIAAFLIGVGVVALAAGLLVLATFGSRLRVGRLLGSTPRVTVDEAQRIAESGQLRYVRIDGRIDSAEEFEDDLHRPLVFRRQRIEVRSGARWRPSWRRLDEDRQEVDFEIRDGLAAVAIDHRALDDGLVVIPRDAVGTAGEVREYVGAGLADDVPVRLRIEQVSSVEHAIALGIVRIAAGGQVEMTAGLGRPLVLTTLDAPEAMRVLAAGDRVRPTLAAVLLALGAAGVVLGLVGALIGAVA